MKTLVSINSYYYLRGGAEYVFLKHNDLLSENRWRVVPFAMAHPQNLDTPVTRFLHTQEGSRLIGQNPIVYESDEQLIKYLPVIDRIRYAAPGRVPQDVMRAAAETGFYIARMPVMADGRIELMQYYRQQSICDNYHRYGNLGERANH